MCYKYSMIEKLREAWQQFQPNSFTVSLRKQMPDVYAWVIDQPYIIATKTVAAKAYTLLYPVAPKCENTNCENTVTTLSGSKWSSYCSNQCRGQYNSLKSRDKAKLTSQQNWGVDNPMQHQVVKDLVTTSMLANHGVAHALQSTTIYAERTKTMLARHGVEHAAQSPVIQAQTQSDWIKKYGVDNPMKLIIIKDKVCTTCRDRYGVDHAQQDPAIRSATENTNMERYGHKCAFQNEEVKAKSSATIYKRYGVANVSQSPIIHRKKLITSFKSKTFVLPSGKIIKLQGNEPQALKRLLAYFAENLFSFDCETFAYILDGKAHIYLPDFELLDTIIEVKSDYTYLADLNKNLQKFNAVIDKRGHMILIMIEAGHMQIIPLSKDIQNFASQFEDCKQLYIVDDTFVNLYFENSKLAVKFFDPRFENDKIYTDIYDKSKLITKFEDLGIQLMFVDINYLKNNFLSLSNTLRAKTNKNIERLFARKCIVRSLIASEARTFYNAHHIQGFAAGTYHYGLFFQDQLVSAMSFSTPRKGIGRARVNGSYELSRFASSVQVIGGASKLMKYFVKEISPVAIYSFSNNFYSKGDLYQKLGFTLESNVLPSYSYLAPNSSILEHRFGYTKHKLKNMPYYSDDISEKEIMEKNGYVRVYDAGKKSWILYFLSLDLS